MSQTTGTKSEAAQVEAIINAQTYMYELGYRDGHAAGLLEADREVSEAVRQMMRDLDSWGWGGL